MYDYATQSLQRQEIQEIQNLNNNLETTNNLICICVFVLILTYITSFVRNIF